MRPRRPSAAGRARKWMRRRPWRGAAPPADPTSSRATGCPSVPRTATASASSCTGAVTWDGVTVSGAASACRRPPAAGRCRDDGRKSRGSLAVVIKGNLPTHGILGLAFFAFLLYSCLEVVEPPERMRAGRVAFSAVGVGTYMPLSLSCLFFLAAVEQKEPEVLAIPSYLWYSD